MSYRSGLAAALALLCAAAAFGQGGGAAEAARDSRVRSASYEADRIYHLRGYVGYQTDVEFEAGERFVGLGAGDVEALAFAAQGNHLFLKPRAAHVRTNLTVLTTRRSYHFDYVVLSAGAPGAGDGELVYTLRFTYPPRPPAIESVSGSLGGALDLAAENPTNRDYWYCGSEALQPAAAFDDGVHTHLRFAPGAELPAVFVLNEDGSEAVVNFSVRAQEFIIHRVVPRLVLRRGKLRGCVVNRGYRASAHALPSGTISPDIERSTRAAGP